MDKSNMYKTLKRPGNFVLNQNSPLYSSLVFAGLSKDPGKDIYYDSTSNRYDGMLQGFIDEKNDPNIMWTWDVYLQRWILYLDGNNDYIELPIKLSQKETTWWVSIWVNLNPSNTGTVGNSITAVAAGDVGENTEYVTTDQFIFSASKGSNGLVWTGKGEISYSNGKEYFVFGPAPKLLEWHNFLLIITSKDAKLFVDGVQLGKNVPIIDCVFGGKIQIGSSSEFDRFLKGAISDFIIGIGSDPPIDDFIKILSDPLNVNLEMKEVILIESIDPPDETPDTNIYVSKETFLDNIKNMPGFYHIAGEQKGEKALPRNEMYVARPTNFYKINVRFVTDNIHYHQIHFAVENEGTPKENTYYITSDPDIESHAKIPSDDFGSLFVWDIPSEPSFTTVQRPYEKLQTVKEIETAKIEAEKQESREKIINHL